MNQQQDGFKKSEKLTRWLGWLIYGTIAISLISIVGNSLEYKFFSDYQAGVYLTDLEAESAAEGNDLRQGLIAFFYFLFWIAYAVVYLCWVYRVNYNAHQLGAMKMRFSSRWAVGWYFIPVMSLWRPYQVMKEIWLASFPPEDWQALNTGSIVSWWWFLYLLNGTVSRYADRTAMRAAEINELMRSNITTQVSESIGVVLLVVVLIMVRKIDQAQKMYALKSVWD